MVDNSKIRKTALVISKSSNFVLHGSNFESQLESGRFKNRQSLLNLESAHQEHEESLRGVEHILETLGYEFKSVSRDDLSSDLIQKEACDLVVTIGGDGTVLSAAKHIHGENPPDFIGVRSSSDSVGYLCACDFSNYESFFQSYSEKKTRTLTQARFCVEVDRADGSKRWESAPILNDALYANAHPAATTRYVIQYDEHTERHKSSGIWIAGAVGSTGAMSAAGGEVLERTNVNLQFKVRELYKVNQPDLELDYRKFLPDEHDLVITNLSESAVLATDGMHGGTSLAYGDRIHVRRADSFHAVFSA